MVAVSRLSPDAAPLAIDSASGRTNIIAWSPGFNCPRAAVAMRARKSPNSVATIAKSSLTDLTGPAKTLFSPTKEATKAVAGSS
jgi:hypothetical protein